MPVKKIFLLDYGWLPSEIDMFLPGKVVPRVTKQLEDKYSKLNFDIPVTGVVLEHTDGRVLFDTGIGPNSAKSYKISKFTDENLVERQLAKVGLKPSDISMVVLSHLHFDHVGQISSFLDYKTPLVVSKKELEYALYMIWLGKDYSSEDLLPLRGASWFPINRRSFELLDGVHLTLTGGHTPGHMVMDVDTAESAVGGGGGSERGRYVFTGDFIHIPEQYEMENGGWLVGDREGFYTNLREIKLMARTRKNTKVVIGHDPQIWSKFPKAPTPLG